MEIPVTEELRTICKAICDAEKDLVAWRLIESDDMFQTANFCGGFDATEDAFCFSYYSSTGSEFWFQFTLGEARQLSDQQKTHITLEPAES
jgi:hypothetical protein